VARDEGVNPGWARTRWPILVSSVLSAIFISRASYVSVDGRSFTLFDDAMVSMRFARNLADGHGLVYNAGQPAVEGFTNLLWTLWMAVLHLAPVPIRIVPLLVSITGAGLLLVGVALIGALGRRLAPGEPLVPAIAMWTVAAYYPLVYWTLRGLEPGLIAVLLAAAVLLAWRIRDRAPGETSTRDGMLLAGVLSTGVLTRIDFAGLAGVVFVWLLWPGAAPAGRRAAWIALGAVLLVLVAQTGFRLAYYGEALPNTYYLKVEGISLTTRLDRGSRAFGALVVSELAVAFALAGIALVCRRSARALLLALLVLAAVAYSVFVGGDAWEYLEYANRYLAPVGPLLLLLAALGVVQVAALARSRQVLILVGLTALVVVAATVNTNLDTDPQFNLRVASLLTTLDRAHWIAALGAAALLLAAALGARMTDNRALVIGPLVATLLLGVTLPAWLEWGRDSGHLVDQNASEAREGLALREAATSDPSIAVVAAGNIPYWSMLPTIDLLGKSDPVIARGPSRPNFDPGHSKWNYRYSICHLRPAVVVQLFEPSPAELRMITRCGYEQVIGHAYVRKGQRGFDRQLLSRAIFGVR
jgi:hypothetical protein